MRARSATTVLAVTGLLVAAPLPAVAAPPPDGPQTLFASSFEPGDPQPAWSNAVETDAGGQRKASGIDGTSTRGIPGSIADKVVEVQANAQNDEGGEVKENLNDGDVNSKWLAFTSTGWVQYKLTAPVTVVDYALTSANDEADRDPKDWTLRGSADGVNWSTLDTQAGQAFTARFQTKEYKFANTTAYQYYRLDVTANFGGVDIIQLAQWQPSHAGNPGPPPPDQKSLPGTGPGAP